MQLSNDVDDIARAMTGLVEQRSGLPRNESCVALSVIKGVFGSALDQFVEHPDDRTLDTIVRDHLQVARSLLSIR